jgi:hypothetical protein
LSRSKPRNSSFSNHHHSNFPLLFTNLYEWNTCSKIDVI